jgi:hypothetical protein
VGWRVGGGIGVEWGGGGGGVEGGHCMWILLSSLELCAWSCKSNLHAMGYMRVCLSQFTSCYDKI